MRSQLTLGSFLESTNLSARVLIPVRWTDSPPTGHVALRGLDVRNGLTSG